MSEPTLRKMLSKRFQIERIYLEKEHEAVTRARQRNKGGKKQVLFTEGWVEFGTKKEAKMAALALNNQLIGGKKRKNAFHDDRWSMRYLSGFKWRHLTEKLVYDQKMRQQRLKTDMTRANKELAYYQEKAELAMQLNKIEERRANKVSKIADQSDDESGAANAEADGSKVKQKKLKNLKKMMDYHSRKRREFKQREPIPLDPS
mmetsp:Transcript_23159/g.27142  ORF Transcript_23159/g.27142 Transcript_23159/m.27142 type:complete len:203 (+) Transcript_23159:117-725(+)